VAKTQRRAAKTAPKPMISPLLVGIVVGIAILVVGGLIVLGNLGTQATAAIDLSQFPSAGNSKASVTIVEYSDYNCGHCRNFNIDTFPRLKADYIDTGKVKYVVHTFNLWPETAIATEAALCAGDQGKFFEYKHALYEKQGQLAFAPSPLTDLAASLGLNRDTFAQCLSNGAHRVEVENARVAAANQGINSTPTFFINNQRVDGNQPYEVFKQIIDQELAKAQ
jgi:protein-disulfide isomerase